MPVDTLPPVFEGRLLSVRAYDANGDMTAAEVVDSDPRALFAQFFADPAVAHIDVHYARRGCFGCLRRACVNRFAPSAPCALGWWRRGSMT